MNNLWGETMGKRPRRSFPIEQEVRYQCVKGSRVTAVGVGKTLEIGSREIQFTTQQPLRVGDKVQLAVTWPALLDNTCRIKLEVFGWIVKSEAGVSAVKIERYEFKTRAPVAVMSA